mmetsp:Transcript_2417/g.7027  ORF Transcript_2417/g.7027 Transcript_2417/m.7027 type:complete len:214 (-) Transcript_2417:455-1096(-)
MWPTFRLKAWRICSGLWRKILVTHGAAWQNTHALRLFGRPARDLHSASRRNCPCLRGPPQLCTADARRLRVTEWSTSCFCRHLRRRHVGVWVTSVPKASPMLRGRWPPSACRDTRCHVPFSWTLPQMRCRAWTHFLLRLYPICAGRWRLCFMSQGVLATELTRLYPVPSSSRHLERPRFAKTSSDGTICVASSLRSRRATACRQRHSTSPRFL